MLQLSRKTFFAFAILFLTASLFLGAQPALAATQQSGDQICTGNNLTIISGQSVGNLLTFGCNVDVQQGATVYGSIADFGGNVKIAGTVNGSIATFGGNVMLTETAVVNGQVASMGGNYTAAPGAVVRGNANTGGIVSPIPPTPPTPISPFSRAFNFGFDILGGIVTALAFAALGALVVIFAPNATRRVSDAVQKKPLNTAGVGCLTLIVLPILGILLTITVIGFPIALLMGILFWTALIFGGIAIGLLTGEKILSALKAKDVLPVIAVMLGVAIFVLIWQIPVLGQLVWCLVGLLGLGAVVMTRFGTRAYPPVPSMALATVAAAPSTPAAPGTYTPTAVDVAAWEAKAREVEARDAAVARDVAPATSDAPASDTPTATEPNATEPPPAGESNPER